jgi:hypothetical protein
MRQPSETKRGRAARYTREQLLSVDSRLRDTLLCETRIKNLGLEFRLPIPAHSLLPERRV